MATPIPPNRARIRLDDAVRAMRGTLVRDSLAKDYVGATTDSRAVVPGRVFVALRGETHDGHSFLAAACERGAGLVIVERGRAGEVPVGACAVVEVDDTLVAWGDLARAHLRAWRSVGKRSVVAVTGSVGKTTTKELCAALLTGAKSRVRASDGNLNNRIGVPAVIFTVDDGCDVAVLECGMSLRGEMGRLAAIVEPDVAIVTNVGLSHAENVGGSREGVAVEKGALYRGTRAAGTLIVNADDDLCVAQARAAGHPRSVSFGRAESADVRLVARNGHGFRGSQIEVTHAGGPITAVSLPIVGDGAAVDFVAALAAVEAVLDRRLSSAEIGAGLAALPPSPGRAHVRTRADGAVVVDDTYNASPQSMRNALDSLSEISHAETRRAICVLGEMRELGPEREAAHDELGEHVARVGVALFVGCGGLMNRALARADARGVRTIAASNADEAAAIARSEVRAGDVVLVKGSRAVGTERIVDVLLASETSEGRGTG